jgi:hypothetical protein
MTRFDRLLADLAEDPTADYQIKKSWIHTGPEVPSAADRRMANKAGAEEFLRSWWDNHARAMARLKTKTASQFAPMIKALKAESEQMAASPAMLQINQANQFHAARGRLADFNRRFTAEVQAGKLTAEETAKVEMAMHRHAAKLDELGRKLKIV